MELTVTERNERANLYLKGKQRQKLMYGVVSMILLLIGSLGLLAGALR